MTTSWDITVGGGSVTARPFTSNQTDREAGYRSTRSVIESVAGGSGDDHLEGSLLRPARHAESRIAQISPLLAKADVLLAPERGFLAALSHAFDVDLAPNLENLLLIQRMRCSAAFLSDATYRREMLNAWLREIRYSPGFLLVDPSTTRWRVEEEGVRLHLARSRGQDLELCVLFGSLGFAQICDDLLKRPIPLLVVPWTREGLLWPRQLPVKSFSQTLRVQRIGRRRLLLFDRRCLC